jgi:hypothetical protein
MEFEIFGWVFTVFKNKKKTCLQFNELVIKKKKNSQALGLLIRNFF